MDQLAMMAEIERAEIVVTFKDLGQGEVEGITYTEIEGITTADLAKCLRQYADLLEAQGDEHV